MLNEIADLWSVVDITLLYIAVCIFLLYPQYFIWWWNSMWNCSVNLLLEMLLYSTVCYKMLGLCYYQEKGVSGRPKHSKTRRLQRRSLRLPTRSKSAQAGHLCTTAQAGADPGIFVCRSKFPGFKVGRRSWLVTMALQSSTWNKKSNTTVFQLV